MLTKRPKLKTHILLLVSVCSLFLVSCGQEPPPPPILVISQSDLVNLMLDIEDSFSLEDVLVSQSGNTVAVRFKAPTLSGTELYSGLAQVFAYVHDRLPSDMQNIDLIFSLNHIDSAIISTDRASIQEWKNGKKNNVEFINTMKKTSLL